MSLTVFPLTYLYSNFTLKFKKHFNFPQKSFWGLFQLISSTKNLSPRMCFESAVCFLAHTGLTLKLFLPLHCFPMHLWCITPPTWRAVFVLHPLVVRWWARQIVKNIPPSDMPEVRSKVAALTALSGERKDWGVSRPWERDYLANVRNTHEEKHKTWSGVWSSRDFHLWSTIHLNIMYYFWWWCGWSGYFFKLIRN